MNEPARVKVSLNQAAEFAAQGFEVECYVLPGVPAQPVKREQRKRNPILQPDAKLTLSLEGEGPRNGKLGEVWAAVLSLYKDDITRQIPVKKLRQYIADMDISSHSDLSKFVYHYKCLREVG